MTDAGPLFDYSDRFRTRRTGQTMSDDHPFRDDEQTKALRAHVDRQLAESVSQPEPVPDAAAEQAEYEALLSATDPIAAFNLFVKRNVDPSLHAHFSDSDANEAEFVRRAIRASMVPRVVLAAGGGAVVGYPGGGASGGHYDQRTWRSGRWWLRGRRRWW